MNKKQISLFIEHNESLLTLNRYLDKGYIVAFCVAQSVSTSVSIANNENRREKASNTNYGGFLLILNEPPLR